MDKSEDDREWECENESGDSMGTSVWSGFETGVDKETGGDKWGERECLGISN